MNNDDTRITGKEFTTGDELPKVSKKDNICPTCGRKKQSYIGYTYKGWAMDRDMSTTYGRIYVPGILCMKGKGITKKVCITIEELGGKDER